MRSLRTIERLGWGFGVLLLVVYGGVRLHAELGRRAGLARFELARQEAVAPLAFEWPDSSADQSLWSSERVEAYEASLKLETGLPLGVLRVPSIALEVPLLDGTDDITLNRAVGRIAGTARIGEDGNIGIAGHRDGFFRGLKDVARGDRIELVTLDGMNSYVVETIWIVEPDAVEVLAPTEDEAITLVTCYPFYYVGSAPQRYIVRAVKVDPRVRAEI